MHSRSDIFERLDQSNWLPKISDDTSAILKVLKRPTLEDVDIITELVSRDKKLSNSLLETINFGYFNLNRRISSLREAIVYLGLINTQSLLIASITKSLLPDDLGQT